MIYNVVVDVHVFNKIFYSMKHFLAKNVMKFEMIMFFFDGD